MEVNYYELFGVNPNATSREIRIAYRRMAEVYHPDKLRELPGKIREEGEEIMRLLNEAKSILLNPDRRLEYDVRRGYRSHEIEQAIVFDDLPKETGYVYPRAVSSSDNLSRKMIRVLSSLGDAFSRDKDFQQKIAIAQEMVEAKVIEDQNEGIEDAYFEIDEDEEIEMTVSFTVVNDEKKPQPILDREGRVKKPFRIVAVESDEDEDEDAAVLYDMEWEEDEE
ncbi:MAG: J domain-containing protein [Thermoplasmatota archaeon]